MTRTRIAAGVALLALALLALPRGSSGDASNPTWAGVWDTDFGRMTLDAGGSGSYEGFTSGTISGHVDGNVDEGTWQQGEKKGTFKFTMSGLSFTGEWHYDTGGCGSACGWNGTCIEGDCLHNNDPPPANEVKTFPAPATFDTTVSGPAPAPGDAAVNKSPALGDAKTVTATVQGLSAEDAVVLAGLKNICYSNFVHALIPPSEQRARFLKDRIEVYYEQVGPDVPKALSDLTFCLAFADALVIEAANSSTKASDPGAVSARTRCRGLGVKFALDGAGRNKKIKSLRVTNGKLRVRCERVRGGLRMKYRTESGGPLRRVAGRRLRLLVVRGQDDPRGGRLSFRYHKG